MIVISHLPNFITTLTKNLRKNFLIIYDLSLFLKKCTQIFKNVNFWYLSFNFLFFYFFIFNFNHPINFFVKFYQNFQNTHFFFKTNYKNFQTFRYVYFLRIPLNSYQYLNYSLFIIIFFPKKMKGILIILTKFNKKFI
jgi:hypothetical protein